MFTLIHAHAFYACMDLSRWADLVGITGTDSVSDQDTQSARRQHMLGCLRGFNAAMGMLCALSVWKESAHFRGTIVVADAVLFSIVTLDAYQLGLGWIAPGVITMVAIAGAVIHCQEPGIFTKDKSKKSD
mmetsp:Transcript_11454/g.21175  ORF Transcript_11454/g.21175 Transcript_11454/m.21175 type:complete len:130 (+) Transcript_11454:64-453(+)